jgi:hypothetical protein
MHVIKFRGTKEFRETLKKASVEAIQAAAGWLALAMQQLVNVGCTIYRGRGARLPHPKTEGGHSGPGQPPRRESGEGQASIRMVRTPAGAIVGVMGIGTTNMIGDNYMAGWDSKKGVRGVRRPWLSRFITEKKYQSEFSRIVRQYMRISD